MNRRLGRRPRRSGLVAGQEVESAMRCVNCQQEINVGGFVCPFCHFHPGRIGEGPYDGGPNSRPLLSSGPGLFSGLFQAIFGSGKGFTVVKVDDCEGGWLKKHKCNRCKCLNLVSNDKCAACGNPFKK